MNAFLRIAAWMLALGLVALPVVAVLNGWIGGSRWPMRTLAVTGEFRLVSEAQVRAAVAPLARRGFFAVRPEEIQDAVARLPWVARAEARKRWPDRLEVTVIEHRPLALWGEDRVLAEDGSLFPRPPQVTQRLPRFDGPPGRVADLIALHRQAREAFAPHGLGIAEVALSPRGSLSLRLSDDSVVEVGRDDAQRRMQRFARQLPRLRAGERRTLVRADLRYTNGFALSWASGRGQAARSAAEPLAAAAAAMVGKQSQFGSIRTANT